MRTCEFPPLFAEALRVSTPALSMVYVTSLLSMAGALPSTISMSMPSAKLMLLKLTLLSVVAALADENANVAANANVAKLKFFIMWVVFDSFVDSNF